MKNKLATIFLLMTSVSYSQRMLKTELPIISNSKLLCSVTKDNTSGYYYYSYSLVNGIGNTGELYSFRIDVTRGVNTLNIDTVGLQYFSKYDNYIANSNRRGYQRWYGKITPVGFPVLPNRYWNGDIENNYKLAWFSTDTLDVLPGDTLRNLVMMSKGLPGLRYCRIVPRFYTGQYVLSEEEDTVETATTPKFSRGNIYSIKKNLVVDVLVVGPISPPLLFDPIIWCDTLANYTTQSRILGWIKDDTTRDKYLSYFSSARTKIVKQDSVGARIVLLQVLHYVNIDITANLTSEAYALLRFNTEYLNMQMFVPPIK